MAERLQQVEQTWVDDETGKTRKTVSTYDESGARVKGDEAEEIPQGELPADFPGRDIFRRAGYGTVEAVRQFRRRGPFTRIEGIDTLTAQGAELILAQTPEDEGDAAAATSADAKATATNTKVSESGGGGEQTSSAPPAPDTRRGAKITGNVGPDSTLGDAETVAKGPGGLAEASVTVDGQKAPAAGHGTEGFIVSDGPGSHLTTSLSEASGATKTVGKIGEEGTSDSTAKGEALKGKLPPDFPHFKELDDAGYGSYAKLRKLVAKGDDWYKGVPGIGEAKAREVEGALGSPEE